MIKTNIEILVNDKSDLQKIKEAIILQNIDAPIYILEYENYVKVETESKEEEWDLNDKIIEVFEEYEFVYEENANIKNARLKIVRDQSLHSIDNWGREIENPLNEVQYLVRKLRTKSNTLFKSNIKALFKNVEKEYFINIASYKNGGFSLIDEFENKAQKIDKSKINPKVFDEYEKVLSYGLIELQEFVNEEYKKIQKKELTKKQRPFRKIVRNFIDLCNKSDNENIVKIVSANIDLIIYENPSNRKIISSNKNNFEDRLKYISEELYNKNIKIKSKWYIDLPIIKIGIKYYPIINGVKSDTQKFERLIINIKDNKITFLTIEK